MLILTVGGGVLAPVPASASGLLFSDGFESGNLSQWTGSSGVVAQQQLAYAGSWGARATSSSGTAAYVYKNLSTSQPDLYYDGRFRVVSSGNNNVSLVRFRTSSVASIFSVMRRNDGALFYYNEVTGATVAGPVLTSGVWHELEVHATINGAAGSIQVWLDGQAIASMTKTDNLGTASIGRVYVGEPSTGRIFDVAYDAQLLSTSADVTPPTAPSSLAATAVGSNRIDLSWSGSTDNVGVTGYTVYRNGAQVTTVPASATSWSDTSVAQATSYTYTVDAIDAAMNHSAQSAPAQATTPALDVTPPSVPTNLNASAVNANRVDLTWTASTDNTGVTGYTIYRNGSLLTTVTTSSAPAYSDTSAAASSTYSYTVDAFDAAANHSAKSDPATATTPAPPDTTPPSTPAAPLAEAQSANRVDVSWNPATDNVGVAGYTLYRDGAVLTTLDATTTTWSDTTVAASTSYSFAVDAFDAAGNHSTRSDPTSVTTPAAVDSTPPSVPSGLAAVAVSATEVDLSWTASSDNVAVDGYTVYRDGAAVATVGPNVTSWADRTVVASTTYSYTVDAFDAAGRHSGESTAASATTPALADTTPPSIPTDLVTRTVGANRVDLTWTASTDNDAVAGYIVYRNGMTPTRIPATSTSWSDTMTAASTTYTYAVEAIDAAGNGSGPSASSTVTTPPPSDTNPPTAPTGLTASVVSSTRLDLAWNAATDDVGVAGYTVYRNGGVLANVGSGTTAFSDATVNHSTAYTYAVDAFDAAGNHSGLSASASITTPGLLFSDGFESGRLNAWSGSTSMVVQQAEKHTGDYAARATSSGAATYVYGNVTPALKDIYYSGWVKVVSQGAGTVSLVRFRTSTLGAILSVMRRGDGRLSYYNEVTKLSTVSAPFSVGTWHQLVVHAAINGAASSVSISLDGAGVLTKTDNLGTSPIGRIYVGDPAVGSSAYDIVFDDQTFSTSADTDPPTVPGSITTATRGSTHVNITWSGSQDNVAVASYSILRDGNKVGTVGQYATGFADFNAVAGSTMAYSVVATDAAGNTSAPSGPVNATTPGGSPGDPTIIAVGDIACDPTDGSFNGGAGTTADCHQQATSDIAYKGNPTAILPLGDEQYNVGSLPAFQRAYDPSWGRVGTIQHPVPGNHEYLTAGASGYYSYFGTAAGDPNKGWYAYDVGNWHVIALNGECSSIGGCTQGSSQEQWLSQNLAAHPSTCTLVYWHEPRFSSGGEHGSDATYAPFWRDLYNAHVDVVLNGHDHDYERFAPQDADGIADPAGPREFVVGTGGAESGPMGLIQPNSEVYASNVFGVLQLTLHDSSYDWSFLNDGGTSFTDSGTASCG